MCGQVLPLPQVRSEASRLEDEIYALNRKIRALPGAEPTPEWRQLKDEHARLVHRYRQAGGRKF